MIYLYVASLIPLSVCCDRNRCLSWLMLVDVIRIDISLGKSIMSAVMFSNGLYLFPN